MSEKEIEFLLLGEIRHAIFLLDRDSRIDRDKIWNKYNSYVRQWEAMLFKHPEAACNYFMSALIDYEKELGRNQTSLWQIVRRMSEISKQGPHLTTTLLSELKKLEIYRDERAELDMVIEEIMGTLVDFIARTFPKSLAETKGIELVKKHLPSLSHVRRRVEQIFSLRMKEGAESLEVIKEETVARSKREIFPPFFKEESYGELFVFLNTEYEDRFPEGPIKTRFSNLYRFCTEQEYMVKRRERYYKWVKKRFEVVISDIFIETDEYREIIFPHLQRRTKWFLDNKGFQKGKE